MKKRISVIVSLFFAILLISSVINIPAKAANISKDEIIKGANKSVTYKNVMRYREKYVGEYVAIPVCIGNVLEESGNEYYFAYVAEYDSSYVENFNCNWDEPFLINNKKYDKSLSWVTGDVIVIYGKYAGITTFFKINEYTDGLYETDIPLIEVYYDVLADDPFDSSYYTDSDNKTASNESKSSDNSKPANNSKSNNSSNSTSTTTYNDSSYNNTNDDTGYTEESCYCTVAAPDGYVNLRTGPGTDYSIIMAIPNGEVLETTNENWESGSRWIPVSYWTDQGWYDGWVARSQVN